MRWRDYLLSLGACVGALLVGTSLGSAFPAVPSGQDHPSAVRILVANAIVAALAGLVSAVDRRVGVAFVALGLGWNGLSVGAYLAAGGELSRLAHAPLEIAVLALAPFLPVLLRGARSVDRVRPLALVCGGLGVAALLERSVA